MASCAASYTARPVANVTRLPPVVSVWPIDSVSATTGWMSCAVIPSTSAAIIAHEARLPPMSGEPVTTLALPSVLMLTVALDWNAALNQKPVATPRPRSLRPSLCGGGDR